MSKNTVCLSKVLQKVQEGVFKGAIKAYRIMGVRGEWGEREYKELTTLGF